MAGRWHRKRWQTGLVWAVLAAWMAGACGGGGASGPAATAAVSQDGTGRDRGATVPEASVGPTQPRPELTLPDDLLAWVPASCQVAVRVDGAGLRQSPHAERVWAGVRAELDETHLALADYLFAQTDLIVMGLDVTARQRSGRALAILRGRFDPERVRALAGLGDEVTLDAHGFAVLPTESGPAVRWVDPSTAVVAEPGLWEGLVKVLSRGEGALQEVAAFDGLSGQAEMGRHTLSLVAVMTPTLRAQLAEASSQDLAFAALSGMFGSIRGVAAWLDVDVGGRAAVMVETASRDQADALASLIRLLRGTVLEAIEDPRARGLVQRARVTSRGPQLRVDATVSEQDLSDWVESVPTLASGGGP